jgi:hypothetical protein
MADHTAEPGQEPVLLTHVSQDERHTLLNLGPVVDDDATELIDRWPGYPYDAPPPPARRRPWWKWPALATAALAFGAAVFWAAYSGPPTKAPARLDVEPAPPALSIPATLAPARTTTVPRPVTTRQAAPPPPAVTTLPPVTTVTPSSQPPASTPRCLPIPGSSCAPGGGQ